MNIDVSGKCWNTTQRPIAVATALFRHDDGTHKAWTRILPPDPTPTPRRAEIMAIVLALEKAVEVDGRLFRTPQVDLNIYSASEYAIECLTTERWIMSDWTRSNGLHVENRDLIERVLEVEKTMIGRGFVRYLWYPDEGKTSADRYNDYALDLWIGGYPVSWEWEWARTLVRRGER